MPQVAASGEPHDGQESARQPKIRNVNDIALNTDQCYREVGPTLGRGLGLSQVSQETSTVQIKVRSAKVWDARSILELVNEHALNQVMLPRSPASIVENIRDFVIAERDGTFVGCGALHVTWTDIAEIRSVAVVSELKKGGIGRAIVDHLVQEAIDLGIPKLFAFTYTPGFFEKMGFRIIEHERLPHKVFNDCMHCPKFQACDEIAMERVLDPEGHKESLFGLPQRRSIPLPRPTGRRPTSERSSVPPPNKEAV